jgi:LacI family transcriptional regulator/LacI family repressor for deo operon, udp, cdd, tsx, nupC, and nupG
VPVTIKDIARVAGVSHTTVSRALKNHPAISRETTQRIQQLARQMGYIPSAVAQSLLSRQTWTIGMVITTIADPFIVKVVEGVEQVAQAANYSVFLATSHNNPDQEVAIVETLHRRRVDAIIVTSSRVGSLYSSQLDQIQVPIVLINNNEEGEYLYSVAVDDMQGAILAAQHLVSLGHRRIGYVGVNNRPKANRRRLVGYEQALTQAGLKVDPALIIYPDGQTDIECGQMSLQNLLTAQATAVFCFNDVVAIGLLMACRRQGVIVPDHLSVVGFDNIEPATYVAPPLTTVAQPLLALGQRAMEMTLDLLAGHDTQDQVLPCQLVVRQSTAPI